MLHKKIYALLLLTCITLPSLAQDDATDTAANKSVAAAPAPAADTDSVTDSRKPIVVVQSKANKKPVTFTVKLAANGTTGFQWFLTGYDQNLIKPLRTDYKVNSKKLMGSSGVSVWEFQVQPLAFTVPHLTHIQFEYRRAWEGNFNNRVSFTVITESNAGTQP